MDWATTFSRFQPGRLPIIGPVAVRVADWSRPQRGQAPMFDHPWLERLSLTHVAYPVAIYAPAGLWLIARSVSAGLLAQTIALSYGLGLLAWSLLEYVVHRGSFHHAPTSRAQVAYAFLVHGIHHAYPDDSRRWVLPVTVTLPIAALFYWLFSATLGRFAFPAFAGFIHGYLAYDTLHFLMHRGPLPTRFGRYLRQYHLAHHYAVPERHFGVSSPLWDFVFRTR